MPARGRMALWLVAVALGLGAAAPASAQPTAPFGHAGRWITDAHGRVVLLHGVNMVSKLAPYEPAATGFGADDAAFLHANGLDVVRVGIILKGLEPSPGVFDDAYLASIRSTVDTLGRAGVLSLLDFHQDMFNERFFGEGFPDWMVQDDGLPNQPNAGFPGNYLSMPAVSRAFDHLWENSPDATGVGLEQRFADAWAHVAAVFRGDHNVLGYDLFNEPWPGSQWPTCATPAGCPAFDQTVLTPFYQRVIGAIRAVDPTTLAFYEPNVLFDFGANTSVGPVGQPGTAMDFHDYCLSGDVGPAAGAPGGSQSCSTTEDQVLANADAQAQRTGDALLLSEFGSTDDLSDLGHVMAGADSHLVSWIYWAYCGCGDPTGSPATEGIVVDPSKPLSGANLHDPAKLDLLAQPYPQVTAGTPQRFAYDAGTRTFTFSYTTARAAGGRFGAGARSEVVMPARDYPSGYRATATGARVVSGCGAPTLVLAARTGATSVSVRAVPSACPASARGHRRAAHRGRAAHRRHTRRHGARFTG